MKLQTLKEVEALALTTLDVFQMINSENRTSIEDEKEVEVWVSYAELNRFIIHVRWVKGFKETREWDSSYQVYDRQGLFVHVGSDSNKVIKDLVDIFESVASSPLPENIYEDNFDELLADEKRDNS